MIAITTNNSIRVNAFLIPSRYAQKSESVAQTDPTTFAPILAPAREMADNVKRVHAMKTLNTLLFVLAIAAVGCGKKDVYVDANGNTVSVEHGTKDVKIQTKDGSYEATNDGKSVTMKTDSGTVSMNSGVKVSEADLGAPFYPGSEDNGQSQNMEVNGKKTFVSLRTTADSPEKVIEFYKGKLTGIESSSNVQGFSMITAKVGDRRIMVQASNDGGKTTINATNAPAD